MKSEHNEELLKFTYNYQKSELEYRRNREHQIFSWTASILLAIIAALFFKSPSTEILFKTQNIAWRLLFSIVVIGLTIYSIGWQHYHNTKAASHKKLIISIIDKLKLFDGNSPILSSKWRSWGTEYVGFRGQHKYPSKMSATAFLGIVGLLAIWIDFILKMN
ncbi:hypothetical protein [Syntrophobacter fumaroxidans]|uniref:hypothetical protein n=1 Tax=Syntrophobacter fumaroxidans TaxID=119484 RepID=UPI00123770AD|nr:hypothetical protein [Syntrophobacter fumaroxidans]